MNSSYKKREWKIFWMVFVRSVALFLRFLKFDNDVLTKTFAITFSGEQLCLVTCLPSTRLTDWLLCKFSLSFTLTVTDQPLINPSNETAIIFFPFKFQWFVGWRNGFAIGTVSCRQKFLTFVLLHTGKASAVIV